MVAIQELNRTIKQIQEQKTIEIRNFVDKYCKEQQEKLDKNKEYQKLQKDYNTTGDKIAKFKKQYSVHRWTLQDNLRNAFMKDLLQVKLSILTGENKKVDPSLAKLFEWDMQKVLKEMRLEK